MRLAKVSARSEEMSLCLGEGQTLFLVEDLASGRRSDLLSFFGVARTSVLRRALSISI